MSASNYQEKKNNLFLVLAGFFIMNALLAEILGVKIFSLEKLLQIPPAQISFFGQLTLDFNLTAGVILWPAVFLTTDIINEYFGKKGVRKISFITVGLIAFAFLLIYVITILPPADFWLDYNNQDAKGNPFNIDYAYNLIFQQGLGIMVGSLFAFLVGQLLDVFVFQKLRKITGQKMIWLRATGSTLVSQFIDSFVVLFIAFYFWGNWPIQQVLAVGVINYIYKFSIAIVLTPLLYVGHMGIDLYLGKKNAELLAEEAAESSKNLL
ncbi:queuosine precursor transporter [Reichenbachiella agarivorans]|uniref:Probable queuosine precursor transporter n=1 Tax=Reichenbachiella agarivorans TaxID=2979464 RepID=A0ABY6CX37_9BACT|nr:queuosine precursor transporter [Reichenbachiella agarivorans]UXP33958.1 queuosine precursor transporter [Reichenbachiella agarivorans]